MKSGASSGHVRPHADRPSGTRCECHLAARAPAAPEPLRQGACARLPCERSARPRAEVPFGIRSECHLAVRGPQAPEAAPRGRLRLHRAAAQPRPRTECQLAPAASATWPHSPPPPPRDAPLLTSQEVRESRHREVFRTITEPFDSFLHHLATPLVQSSGTLDLCRRSSRIPFTTAASSTTPAASA